MVSSSCTNIVPTNEISSCSLEQDYTCCAFPPYHQDVSYLQFLELLFYDKEEEAPKKDRHRKIETARGPRDRRMRLSLDVATRFFRLQDALGYQKPSDTVHWLLTNAAPAIAQLHPTYTTDCVHDDAVKIKRVEKKKKKKKTRVAVGRESRIKARERARERTRRRHHPHNTGPMHHQQYWNPSLITNYNPPAPSTFFTQIGEFEFGGEPWGEEAAFNTCNLGY